MAKLAKKGCCSSFKGILIVGKIGKVGHNTNAVANDEKPFAKALIAIFVLKRSWNQLQQDKDGIDVDECRNVKL